MEMKKVFDDGCFAYRVDIAIADANLGAPSEEGAYKNSYQI